MADEKNAEQNPDAAGAPAKKGKMWVWILVGVIVVGGGVTGGILFLGSDSGTSPDESGSEEQGAEPAGLIPLDTFLVNLRDPGSDRFAKLTLRLTVTPSSVANEVMGDELLLARVRDKILTILTSKTYAEMGSPLGKEGLRREIQAHVSPLLDGGRVQDVLFSEFVVQ